MNSRLTTSTMYGAMMQTLQASQRKIQDLQRQIASGNKYRKLSDNPAAITRSLHFRRGDLTFYFLRVLYHTWPQKNITQEDNMLDYRHQNFIFDMRDKLDELAYGAHNLAGTAGLTPAEEQFLEQLSRDLYRLGDMKIRFYNALRCMTA